MNYDKLKLKIDLTLARIEILKMKADDYNWQCHTPDDVKLSLEESLIEINETLKNINTENSDG